MSPRIPLRVNVKTRSRVRIRGHLTLAYLKSPAPSLMLNTSSSSSPDAADSTVTMTDHSSKLPPELKGYVCERVSH